MRYDFDLPVDRRASDSTKWHAFDEDVLPLWTADMDFRVAEPIVEALRERLEHPVYGYCGEPQAVRDLLASRMANLYGWEINPDDVVLQTGVLASFQDFCRVAASPSDGVLVQPPVYPPIFGAPAHNGSVHREAPLVRRTDGTYEIDFDAFEAGLAAGTRVFILCNPHNPVGRVFTPDELARLADACLRHGVLICADEIHCDLVYEGHRHTPIASLAPEVARRTVTLMAPTKTFNIPGLRCSFAIAPDPALRARIANPSAPQFSEVNAFGLAAMVAAYRDGHDWLAQVLAYLQTNRDMVVDYVRREMPHIRVAAPEATYLAWLDCRDAGIAGDPYRFFLDRARVGLSDGPSFGTGGEGFVRVNFACPRPMLMEALVRMRTALAWEAR